MSMRSQMWMGTQQLLLKSTSTFWFWCLCNVLWVIVLRKCYCIYGRKGRIRRPLCIIRPVLWPIFLLWSVQIWLCNGCHIPLRWVGSRVHPNKMYTSLICCSSYYKRQVHVEHWLKRDNISCLYFTLVVA